MRELHIFTEGDQQRGLGHLTRCSAYAEAWKKTGRPVQWFVDGDHNAQIILQSSQVEWGRWQEQLVNIAPKDSVAIVDSYSANLDVLTSIANNYHKVVYIDDTYRINYPKGIVIHASPDAQEVVSGEAKWLRGPKWQPLRPSFSNIKTNLITKVNITDILVIMGGTDLRELTPQIVALALKAYPNATIHAVTNKKIQLPAKCINHTNLDALQIANLMNKCDLAISAAGQTTYELAALRIPSIIICLIDNQEPQFLGWSKNGCFPDAYYWNSTTIHQDITFSLIKNKNISYRLKQKKTMRRIMDTKGTFRLIKLIDIE